MPIFRPLIPALPTGPQNSVSSILEIGIVGSIFMPLRTVSNLFSGSSFPPHSLAIFDASTFTTVPPKLVSVGILLCVLVALWTMGYRPFERYASSLARKVYVRSSDRLIDCLRRSLDVIRVDAPAMRAIRPPSACVRIMAGVIDYLAVWYRSLMDLERRPVNQNRKPPFGISDVSVSGVFVDAPGKLPASVFQDLYFFKQSLFQGFARAACAHLCIITPERT